MSLLMFDGFHDSNNRRHLYGYVLLKFGIVK